MFIEPMITWVPLGFSGYIWLDTKIVFKKNVLLSYNQLFGDLFNIMFDYYCSDYLKF